MKTNQTNPNKRTEQQKNKTKAIHDQHAKQPAASGAAYTEADWNRVSTLEAEPYWVSKVRAEELAWALAKELSLDVVTVLPNFVLGPVAGGAADGVSVGFMKVCLCSVFFVRACGCVCF